MPIPKDKRDYAHETALEKARPGAFQDRMERQRARRALDKKGINRKGKDVSHVVALTEGGSNKDGVFLNDPKSNESYSRKANHKPKSRVDGKAKSKRVYKV